MSELKVADSDSRGKQFPEEDTLIEFKKGGEVVGLIRCSRPGVQLVDFYRTSMVLAKDVPARKSEPSQDGSTLE